LDLGILCQFLLILSLSINHYFKNITPKFRRKNPRRRAGKYFLAKFFRGKRDPRGRNFFAWQKNIFSVKNKNEKRKRKEKAWVRRTD
jgi:hypothetical protein